MNPSKRFVLIPAYQPEETLGELIAQLGPGDFRYVVVDDGSGPAAQAVFEALPPWVTVLHHRENRGKGAALKTGLGYIARHCPGPYTVVTADADGQHRPADIRRVCRRAEQRWYALILGSRSFTGPVPLRSLVGNAVTRTVYRLSSHTQVHDTQTGLRAFSDALVPRLLTIPGERYEYEMNVLLEFGGNGLPMEEVAIATVYRNGNAASHFRTLWDSLLIYGEILRFSAASLCSFGVDYLIFCLLSAVSGTVLLPNIAARLASATLNYNLNRVLVFHSNASVPRSAVQYALLAAGVLVANTALVCLLSTMGLSGWLAKLVTEAVLFSLSWLAQSRWIFRGACVG